MRVPDGSVLCEGQFPRLDLSPTNIKTHNFAGIHIILILASITRRGRIRPITDTVPQGHLQVRQVPLVGPAGIIPHQVRPVPVTITEVVTDTEEQPEVTKDAIFCKEALKSQKYTLHLIKS